MRLLNIAIYTILSITITHAKSIQCAVQEREDAGASFVMLHTPGLEVSIGAWHPAGSLFEKASSAERALHAHINMVNALREFSIPYDTVPSVLIRSQREDLIELASLTLSYDVEGDLQLLKQANNPNLVAAAGEEYKHGILHGLSQRELVDITITRPTVKLAPSNRNTHVVMTRTEVRPLMNLVFTRDQQVTTKVGVVMGALNSPQREHEVKVMSTVWRTMGIPILGSIKAPGKLEGGDFFPINSTLSMIGVGLRTNEEGVQQMLDKDWFGTDKVVVVMDYDDLAQERMHLDMYFNVVKPGVAVLEDLILEATQNSPYLRLVKEYTRNAQGKYVLTTKNITLPQYLKAHMGWEIVSIPEVYQLEYMINFVNVGNNRIISVHNELERLLRSAGVDDLHVRYVDYSGITTMFGAAHCTTQVFRCN